MTYLQTTAATMNKPKITILPSAEQDVFFQETQFDESIPRHGSGAASTAVGPYQGFNPNIGNTAKIERRARAGNEGLRRMKKRRITDATKALENHPNKEAILKILRSE